MVAAAIVAQAVRFAGESFPLASAPRSTVSIAILLCGMVAAMALVRSTVRSRSLAKFVILLFIGIPAALALLMPMTIVTSSAPVATSNSPAATAVVSGASAAVTGVRDANASHIAISVGEEITATQSSVRSDSTSAEIAIVTARTPASTPDKHQRVHKTLRTHRSWRRMGALAGSVGLSLAMIYFLLEGFTRGHFRGVLIVVTAGALVGACVMMVRS